MNNEIYNDCINLVKTNINGIVVNLIGVYLMYNNNTTTNQSIYESQLSIVSTLIEEFKYKKEEFLVTGDFNGDILRNINKFDKLLSLFIQKNNLKSCFDAIKNPNPFSYSNSICNLLIKTNNIFNLDNNVETRNKMNKLYKDIVEYFKKANE